MKRGSASRRRPVIAVTMGDPGGVGPEIVCSLFSRFRPLRSLPIIVGASSILSPWAQKWGLELRLAPGADEVRLRPGNEGVLWVREIRVRGRVKPGRASSKGGEYAAAAVREACRLVRAGEVGAIVTAPISKESLARAGHHYQGHTEMLADLLGSSQVEMMMVYGKLRIVPLTRHLPLRQVALGVTSRRIVACVELVSKSLRELFGVARPRIGVAALNPHCGDGGVAGAEEETVIAPALASLRRRGINVSGPIAGDVIFQSLTTPAFDAYICMYHDQGLIPFKMRARGRGVNVTLGLPVIRTSVDHGTAFDIAGRGVASTTSLRAAYRTAEKLLAAKGTQVRN